MNRQFSVYLDLVRFGAAVLVYLYHSNQRWLVQEVLPLSDSGHAAVIVFFVLSGFVIAWVTDTKEREWTVYAASRLSRVYSVAVPALVLCLVLDAVGRELWAKPYSGYPFDQLLVRELASLLMLNEVWFVSITSLSNVPYWSITFEFWYYVLFGLIVFLPARVGWACAALLLAMLGPKIALLAPIWGAGVLLYRWKALERITLGWGLVLALGGAVGIVAGHSLVVFKSISAGVEDQLGAEWYRELTFAKFFLADYLLGVLVFVHFAGMRRVAPLLRRALDPVAPAVQWLAGYTFTLYLLHQPLFLFWGAVLRGPADTMRTWWLVTGLTALTVVAVGWLTEQRRQGLRQWLHHRLQALPGSCTRALSGGR